MFAPGVFEVIEDVPTGLVVLQLSVTLQLLAPAAIVQEAEGGVSVPERGPRHTVPFQVVPDAQLAVADLLASSTPLLYRKKLRPARGTGAEPVPLLPVNTVKFALG